MENVYVIIYFIYVLVGTGNVSCHRCLSLQDHQNVLFLTVHMYILHTLYNHAVQYSTYRICVLNKVLFRNNQHNHKDVYILNCSSYYQ